MIPTLLASGIIIFGIIQIAVAVIAVFLAVKWKKSEFLPGLCFLLLYAIIELIDLFFFTFVNRSFIDVAQFGFILLAIIFFIIGMHPSWAQMMPFYNREQHHDPDDIPPKKSLLSIVKKI